MKEDENKSLELFEPNLLLMPELAYFRKNYWKQRNEIFNELYKILYNNELAIDEKEKKDNQLKYVDPDDSFSDIKNYDENDLKIFDDDKSRNLRCKNNDLNEHNSINENIENKEDEEEDEEINEESDSSIKNNFSFSNNFIKDTRIMLYNNYLNNYIKKKYIFSKEDFSLRAK